MHLFCACLAAAGLSQAPSGICHAWTAELKCSLGTKRITTRQCTHEAACLCCVHTSVQTYSFLAQHGVQFVSTSAQEERLILPAHMGEGCQGSTCTVSTCLPEDGPELHAGTDAAWPAGSLEAELACGSCLLPLGHRGQLVEVTCSRDNSHSMPVWRNTPRGDMLSRSCTAAQRGQVKVWLS